MLVAVEGEEDFQVTEGVYPPFLAMWSAPWEVGDVVKVSVCPLRPRNGVRSDADTGISFNSTFLFTHFLSSLS